MGDRVRVWTESSAVTLRRHVETAHSLRGHVNSCEKELYEMKTFVRIAWLL